MFNIKFFPARFGDAIRIAYGDPVAPRLVLIDGGTGSTRMHILADLNAFAARGAVLDLIVVTHIDRDHIEGIIKLLEDTSFDMPVGDFWFNGWRDLPDNADDEPFGPVQGEELSVQFLKRKRRWNEKFAGKAVVVPDAGPLPTVTLDGGLKVTLLNPRTEHLADLKPVWAEKVREAGLEPGYGLEEPDDAVLTDDEGFGAVGLPDIAELAASAYEDDRSEANRSSIAFLAEYAGRCVLLTGDAPAGPLLAALERLSPARQIPLSLLKVSHHGSKATTSRELIEKVRCPLYVISTNGNSYEHPDVEAIARIISAAGRPLTLAFNYRSPVNALWDNEIVRLKYGYSTRYPTADEEGIEILDSEMETIP